MIDTVKRIMEFADKYADARFEHGFARSKNLCGADAARQALRDELTRLFTPLTDELLLSRWQITPVLDNLEAELCWQDYHTLYEHFVAMHGITGESK